MTDEWLATPVLTDKGKRAVLDLVPLAGSRRQMTDGNPQAGFVRQLLQLHFPKAYARPVAPTRIRRNQQPTGPRIKSLPHRVPPAPDALHRDCRRIVIHAYADPACVVGDIVNPVGIGSPPPRNNEVVHAHLLRVALRAQLPPIVLEIAYQFLFLGVHRNDELMLLELAFDFTIQVLELGIAVRMVRS